MDFRFPNQRRNYGRNFDHNWGSPVQLSLQSLFPGTSFPRNLYLNMPVSRMNENLRNTWNITNNRRSIRRFPKINEMRNSVRRATQEMYDAYHDFDNAKFTLEEAKNRLETKKQETVQMKTDFQTSMIKLERIVNNFQSPRMLNKLNPRERNVFQGELDSVRHEIDEARIRIREFDTDIDEDDASVEQTVREQHQTKNGVKRLRADQSDEAEAGVSGWNVNSEGKDKSEDITSCSVCMENPVNAVLYTCGHMCMCFSCSRKLLRRRGDYRRCPMCRAVIRDVIKIYKS